MTNNKFIFFFIQKANLILWKILEQKIIIDRTKSIFNPIDLTERGLQTLLTPVSEFLCEGQAVYIYIYIYIQNCPHLLLPVYRQELELQKYLKIRISTPCYFTFLFNQNSFLPIYFVKEFEVVTKIKINLASSSQKKKKFGQ